jgi:hypothetical protein
MSKVSLTDVEDVLCSVGISKGDRDYVLERLHTKMSKPCPGVDTRAEDFCSWLDGWNATHSYPPAIGDAWDAAYRSAWARSLCGNDAEKDAEIAPESIASKP